jgi:hypothetical protein
VHELPTVLELRDILSKEDYKKATVNYEEFFTEIVHRNDKDLIDKLEQRTWDYFSAIKIQNTITLYDKLVLALRPKDTIISFNWDPLLPYAYRRNGFLRTLPALWFLHGNVLNGYCPEHMRIGWNDDKCSVCKKPLIRTPLLHPVFEKDYESHSVLSESWRHFDHELMDSYFLTIFGYSAPESDKAARLRIHKMLDKNRRKNLAQLELVDINYDYLIKSTYKELYKTMHVSLFKSINSSWIMQFSKLSCEALYYATLMQEPIHPNPQLETNNLTELQGWAKEFDDKYPEVHDELRSWQG